jgi:hypothetical protein
VTIIGERSLEKGVFSVQDLVAVLLDWRIILIAVIMIFILPLIFYLSSLDKKPVKVKKVKMKIKKVKKIATEKVPDDQDEEDDDRHINKRKEEQ